MAYKKTILTQATGELPGELITKKELAQRLRISTRKIELDRNFPCVRFGRTVRYDWKDVVEYLKGGTEA
jgi:hypothetical protein